MKNLWNPDELFSMLLKNYAMYMSMADSLESSNKEDTYEIKLAIVGFSLFNSVEAWGYDFYKVVKDKLDGELSPVNLEWHGDYARTYAQFACLALGSLLGKYASKKINDDEFFLADACLAGFMHLHLIELE